MSISNSDAGLIVGSKWRTIQQLEKDTGTKISILPTKAGNRTTVINNDYHQNGDSTFIIKGKAPNVASAVRQLKKAMEEGKTANLRSERQKEKEYHRNEGHEHRTNRRSDNETHSHGGRSRSPVRRF